MSNQISAQATKLGKIIADPGTLGSYQQTLTVTLNILKESALLAWFVLCLSLVAIDWFWNNAIGTGQSARTWLNNLQAADSTELPNQFSQGMLTVGKSSLSYVVAQAREQIGLPAKEAASIPSVASVAFTSSSPTTADVETTSPDLEESSVPKM